eukprot:CAMPEP_0172593062 /NCGR_PEP_ID=MMETSP1068-20121228/12261_1 /TAXON_ID=35684 /ORGANISM="Pseudopedinella elastica, Strain CCMP716" /LENGTH=250 /DNA_ID=CAMNT_0013390437 /DNA_START=116 /DNA_END=865 /DNA_ORIENTATION=-
MEAQLAREILGETFGESILPVVDALIGRYPGYIRLDSLIAGCAPSPPEKSRLALQVLLRHGVVIVAKKPPVENVPGPLIYKIKLEEIARRLFFPEYGTQAREEFGDLGAVLVEELAVHGHRTSAELLEVCREGGNHSEEQVQRVFRDMVQRRFILRVKPWGQTEAELEAQVAVRANTKGGSKVSKYIPLSSAAHPAGAKAESGPRKRRAAAMAEAPEKRARGLVPPEMRYLMQQGELPPPPVESAPQIAA